MSQPFLGEIKMFGYPWAPKGWAKCDGQLMQIANNQTLFALIGTQYGGDGRTTFALPDFRGRVPIHRGMNNATGTQYKIGQMGGVEDITLTTKQMPAHKHLIQASGDDANQFVVGTNANTTLGASIDSGSLYEQHTTNVNLDDQTITDNGGSQSHYNIQPSLVISFCIAIQGTFPQRN